MKVLWVLVAIATCASGIYDPREDDINFKRYQTLITPQGEEETVDLLSDTVTVRATESDVTYYLYTRSNRDVPHIVQSSRIEDLELSPYFDPSKEIVLITHGWANSHTADVNVLLKAAILDQQDLNIIVVDWSPVAAGSYTSAQAAVTEIGQILGNSVNTLLRRHSITGDRITLIGHSLGAHISGNAGAVITSKVKQIIGLDPAAPSFTVDNTANRLDPSDAQYVAIIHTNGNLWGFSSSIGHIDFYPNGGQIQAGCGIDLLGACSHARAFQYLAEVISGGRFVGTKCASYDLFQAGQCSSNQQTLLGFITVDQSAVGDFFFNTNTAAPFAQG